MPLLDDPVKELAAGAELHDEVHGDGVLVGGLDGDHVGVPRQVVHYLDLPADVLHVVVRHQLPLEDGLAGVLLAGGPVHAQVRRAELALAQPPAQAVLLLDALRLPLQDRAHQEARTRDALHLGRLGPVVVRLRGLAGVGGDGVGIGGRG